MEITQIWMLGEHSNTCKSLAFGSWFIIIFSRVLPTSRVGYHASKPIESVIYCLNTQNELGSRDTAPLMDMWLCTNARRIMVERFQQYESWVVCWQMNWLFHFILLKVTAYPRPRFEVADLRNIFPSKPCGHPGIYYETFTISSFLTSISYNSAPSLPHWIRIRMVLQKSILIRTTLFANWHSKGSMIAQINKIFTEVRAYLGKRDRFPLTRA